jgi:hypothetical protein
LIRVCPNVTSALCSLLDVALQSLFERLELSL